MPLENTESLQQGTMDKIFPGSSSNGPRQTGSHQHDFLLTFGIKLEVDLAFDTSSFQRNAFMNNARNSLYAEIKHVKEHVPQERHIWDIPKPALWLAQEILRREGLHVASMGYAPDDEDKPYSGWGLIEDSTIKYDYVHAEALKCIPERIDKDVPVNVMGGGVELVSRKFQAPDLDKDDFSCSSLEETSNYVNALTGKSTDPFACFINDSCGLHVHVGVAALESPNNALKFPLAILQHLCYMLVQYETVISSFFPTYRRGMDPKVPPWLNSNMMGVRRTRQVCECYADKSTEDRLSQIEAQIFAPDMTIDRLMDYMSGRPLRAATPGVHTGTRHKFISFENLSSIQAGHSAPPTLEFRQHESILGPNAIHHWIFLVLSLVRAAEREAKKSPQPTCIPSTISLEDPVISSEQLDQENKTTSCILEGTLEDLFDLLSLKEYRREYWLGRFKRFNPDEVPEPTLDPEYWSSICPECYGEEPRCDETFEGGVAQRAE